MLVKEVPTLGWTRGNVAATLRLVTQQQREEMAARIREEMERRGWTNVKLARTADVSDKTVSRLINAKKDPHYNTVEKVARALGVEEAELRGPPPAPLGLGADSQLDRIERRVEDIYALLTPPSAADEDGRDEVEGALEGLPPERPRGGAGRKPRKPGRSASE